MLEILVLFGLLTMGLVLAAIVAVAGFVLKIGFKILFFPVVVGLGLVKLIFLLAFLAVGIAIAPLLLAGVVLFFVVALPVLLLVGAVGVGVALAAS